MTIPCADLTYLHFDRQGCIDHSLISNVTADQHHNQSHDHSAAGDGTTLTPATLNIPSTITPAQTAEGQAVWDSDDDKFTVGDGVGRKTMAREDLAVMDGDAAGGDLGGTYPSPTVNATHSGTAHHAAVTLGVGSDAILSLSGQELTLGDVATQAELDTHAGAADPHTVYRLESADHSHQSTGAQAGQLDHGLALTGLGDDDHPQYRLESVDHTHQSTGAEAGQLDHGLALTGLTDDDHTQYLKHANHNFGTDLNLRITAGVDIATAVAIAGVNDAVSANIPLEFRGTAYHFLNGAAQIIGVNRFRHLNSMAKVTNTGNRTITDATITILTWDTDEFDTDAVHSTVSNTSRLVANVTGKYLLHGNFRYDPPGAGVTGSFHVGWRLNGSAPSDKNIAAIFGDNAMNLVMVNAVIPVTLTAADFVEFWAFQNTGASQNLNLTDTFAALEYVGE